MTYSNSEKLFELLDQLPDWYRTMLLGIPVEDMKISTKVGYCRDVIAYFNYISSVNPIYKTYSPKDFTLDDLDKITP